MGETKNILIVGVGGQGTILASRVLSNVLQKIGLEVKVSEIHGMAQRGGSVVTQVRYGQKVASPIIPEGQADIILAFEKLEALRWLTYLKEEGIILINDQRIDPMPVIIGAMEYPDALDNIRQRTRNVLVIDALKAAQEAGNVKTVNIVLLGLLAKFMNIDQDVWLETIEETVPSKFLQANLKAFKAGLATTENLNLNKN
ncbi:MAG: indolepyruvate oxidoreductase subunit beta [Peptococcaceae bacterium]|mgnify:FL=1|nr:indolepyruvate oxidoreductase subunit beta [Peptococcaceae bacterium]